MTKIQQEVSSVYNMKLEYTILRLGALICEELSPPDNGEISVAPGPNSLSNGLGSVATYSCDPGYGLVGQTTRECQSVFGGATAGWTGYAPVCQGKIVK